MPTEKPERPALDLERVRGVLDAPEVRSFGGPVVGELSTILRTTVARGSDGEVLVAADGRPLGRRLQHGSVVLDHPTARPRARVAELDREGHLVALVRRDARGAFQAVRLYPASGGSVSLLPGGAWHPLWGTSDRLVGPDASASSELLTIAEATTWDAISFIPALADPTRLRHGAGSAVLNLIAGLAQDQGSAPLAYRGPYPTEQLFWALVESFRVEGGGGNPVATFTRGAEATFREGRPHVTSLRWIAAPYEQRGLAPGLAVFLREGVEKVIWEERAYRRSELQGLRRREHRVLRVAEPSDLREVRAGGVSHASDPDSGTHLVASLWALDRPLENHFILEADGRVVAGPLPGAAEPVEQAPLGPLWESALGALLPLEATPLLAGAIAHVWSGFRPEWGPVPRDLVVLDGGTLRLSWRLARAYQTVWAATPRPERRKLARELVQDVLGLLGEPVRREAARWLAALPLPVQEAKLADAMAVDREALAARALNPLGQLLAALEAEEAVPAPPGG